MTAEVPGRKPEFTGILDALRRTDWNAQAAPLLPADPFGASDAASIALADMYHSMVRAGIPVKSAEVILGQMLGVMMSGQPGGNAAAGGI